MTSPRTSPLSVREGKSPWSIWLFLLIMVGYTVLGVNLSENERGRLQALDDIIRHVSGGVLTGIVVTIFIEEVTYLMLVAIRRAKEWGEKRQAEQRKKIAKEIEANVYKGLLQVAQHQRELSDWYKRFNEAKQQGRHFDESPPDFHDLLDLRDLFDDAINNEPYNSESGADEHSK